MGAGSSLQTPRPKAGTPQGHVQIYPGLVAKSMGVDLPAPPLPGCGTKGQSFNLSNPVLNYKTEVVIFIMRIKKFI